MNNIIRRIKNQSLKKLLIMFYNFFRMIIIKIFHFNSNISLLQNINPFTEIDIKQGGIINLSNSIYTRRNVTFRVERGYLEIGTSFFNQGCSITAMKNIRIGKNCLFGPNVVIIDHDHDYKFINEERGNHYLLGDIVIGNNVWIGANVTILRDTIIEDGCVVGANSVVKGHFSSNQIIMNDRSINIKKITE